MSRSPSLPGNSGGPGNSGNAGNARSAGIAGSAVISVRELRKSYAEHLVLDGIDLDVVGGTVFGLLGPNGAGKTTTVRILSTLTAPDSGRVSVAGHDPTNDPDAVRSAIGVTGQFSAVDDLLTGQQNLALMADLHHLPKPEGRRITQRLLERFDLADAANKPAATYSGGMRRRLDLAMGLVGNPSILFLDEPTTGLVRAAGAPCGRSSVTWWPRAPRSS